MMCWYRMMSESDKVRSFLGARGAIINALPDLKTRSLQIVINVALSTNNFRTIKNYGTDHDVP